MRGPRGKGQCQVAVVSDTANTPTKDDGSLISSISGAVMDWIGGKEKESSSLECSMTFVHVDWKSIVEDVEKGLR